ncbi:glycosyltransferase family 2 protein [Flavivirga spongiicola]|uniref:Glycosyltransferase n=1 Tax=Flavivirga spongiicola TaxID=421621 RepID=A0ABU7XNJ6_9FLAO|nr:glycosyltransferase family 2 protein [Flavivirga sp. MEBiC05379]MDO5981677.1 glycosyltransferase family 2 protein [Flavivirga sp. MEBiC05379]
MSHYNFSLIVCTYMRSEALLNLLNSVNTQSLYPNEILIIDGSVDDKTKLLLEENKFKNLKYSKVEVMNRGLTKQRNYGINLIADNSDIVCFLDDDIVLTSNYFKNLIETYNLCPEAMAVGGYIKNEVEWEKTTKTGDKGKFHYDGWMRNEPARFKMRRKFGLLPDTAPGFLPSFAHGRSVGFLPPSGKIYQVEQIMGGVSSYKKEIFRTLSFSTYFEGYGLYEDADFSLRLAKQGKLYVNTNAKLSHHHDDSGRPNKYKYGKMVLRNGWYVWRVKYPIPSLKAKFKWHATAFLLTLIRFTNVITSNKKKEALTESIGRVIGWFSLLISKPNIEK